MPCGSQRFSFAASTIPGLFPCPRSIDHSTVPLAFSYQVHPSLSSYPFRVPTTQRLLVSFRTRADLPGLSLLFAASPVRVYSTRKLPNSHYVPPSGFHSLSVVYSAHRLAGLFHPTATFRILPFRGLLPPCSHLPSSGRVAPMSLCLQLLPIRGWSRV